MSTLLMEGTNHFSSRNKGWSETDEDLELDFLSNCIESAGNHAAET